MHIAVPIIGFVEMVFFLYLARSYNSMSFYEQLLVVPGLAISIIDMYLLIATGIGIHAYVAITAQGCMLTALCYIHSRPQRR